MKKRIFKLILVIMLGLTLAAASSAALADSLVLSGVPEYLWYYGCSPTSGGMLMGYWAGKGYSQLLPGVTDPMVQSDAVNNAIASPQHIAAGQALGYTYGSYKNHTSNCIADFMQTENGGTYMENISTGLLGWTSYVGLTATSSYSEVSILGGTFDYTDFVSEINAGRPMLLNLVTFAPYPYYATVGHTVLAYGYQDAMFNIRIPIGGSGHQDITVGGFAVMDTWKDGPSNYSTWLGWNGNVINSIIDDNGVEWWPYLDLEGWSYTSLYDWQITSGVFYQPAPVPPTLVLLGSGLLILLWPRRKRRSHYQAGS
jgi:hypothetical protein